MRKVTLIILFIAIAFAAFSSASPITKNHIGDFSKEPIANDIRFHDSKRLNLDSDEDSDPGSDETNLTPKLFKKMKREARPESVSTLSTEEE